MQLPFAICLEASRYAMSELGLPNVGSHYAKLTVLGFFTWGEMPLKTGRDLSGFNSELCNMIELLVMGEISEGNLVKADHCVFDVRKMFAGT